MSNMSNMSNQFEALVQTEANGQPQLSKKLIDQPKPDPYQVLVRVSYAAQNPTDVQSLDSNAFGDGAVLGCDFVGTVEKLGSAVTKLAEGDVVAGLIWGGEIKGLGAFSQYTVADERIAFRVPQGIPPEAAATVPLAATTAWLALFSRDCLAIDRNTKPSVLIWGGSSSVGLYAIQIASLYGFDVATTCSPRNFDLVRAHGAAHVFNYRDEEVVGKIKESVPNLRYIFDTIGSPDSSNLASQAVESSGVLCTVRPGKAHTENVPKSVKVTDVLVWTAFLKEHRYGDFHWPPHQEDHELANEFFEKLPAWLQEGRIKPSQTKVLHGLDSVLDGFQEHRDNKISAYKVVYEL